MPNEQNTNHTPETPNATKEEPTPTPEENATEKPKGVLGALNKALVRTFRGDLADTLGADHADIERYLPQQVKKETTPVIQKPQERNKAIVHTLGDDVQHLVRNQKMSVVRMAAMESDRGRTNSTHADVSANPWKTTIMVLFIALLVLVAVVIAAGGYYAYQLNTSTPTTHQLDPGILFTESREPIDISGRNSQAVLTFFSNIRRTSSFALGAITELYLTKTPEAQSLTERPTPLHIPPDELLTTIEARVPSSFLGTLEPEYMLGIYATDDGNMPFLVFTTSSYSYAFSGLLAWEAYMFENLRPFFVSIDATPQTGGFVDTVYDNIDARVLYDTTGKVLLVYGFVDRSTFVITTSQRALVEVMSRIRVNHL